MNKRKLLTLMGGSTDFRRIITPTLGSNVLLNSGFETNSPPENWSALGSNSTRVTDTRTGGSGTYAMNVARLDNNYPRTFQVVGSLSAGAWYRVDGWEKNIDATNTYFLLRNQANNADVCEGSFPATTTWTSELLTGMLIDAGATVGCYAPSGTNGKSGRFDDVTLKPITLSSCFGIPKTMPTSMSASNYFTTQKGSWAGVALNIDSITNPQSFVLGLCDTNYAWMVKYVAGTASIIIAKSAITYVANSPLEVRHSGTTYSLFYNSTQVGGDITVSDAQISSNTISAQFASSEKVSVFKYIHKP